MSLINDMLNDLEARRANEVSRGGLSSEIRPLPRLTAWESRRPLLLKACVLLIVLAMAVAGWMYRQRTVSVVEVLPLPAPSVSSSSAVEIQPAVVPEGAPLTAASYTGLRASTSLANLPLETSVSSVEAVTSTTVKAMVTTTTVPLAGNKTAPLQNLLPATVPGGAVIDKRNTYANPREKLDADVRSAVQIAAGGRSGEAIEQLREILRADPAMASARQALLRVLLEQRRTEEMTSVLSEGLDLLPQQTGWAMSLARLWVERGELAGAQRVLARSLPYASANADYLAFYGHIHFRQGHHREAVEAYLAATRIAPAEGRLWLGYGLALEADGQAAEARDALRRALATGTLNADLAALAEQKIKY